MRGKMKRIGIYVDGQTLFKTARTIGPKFGIQGAKPDYEAIMDEARQAASDFFAGEEIEVETATVYTVGRHSSRNFERALEEIGFDLEIHVLRQAGTCRECLSSRDTFSWRTQIVVDVLEDVNGPMGLGSGSAAIIGGLDAVVLVAGSSEFKPLAKALERGAIPMITLGFPERVSDKLPNIRFLTKEALYDDQR